jgi:hypothetical protein
VRPAPAPTSEDDERLLAHVRGRDVPCPQCGYSLRDLVDPRCPECGERLELRVGVVTPRFGWLVAAMAPGMFSGVCAVLLAGPLLWMFRYAGAGGPPWILYIADAFGFLSCLAAVWMYRKRRRVMAWRTPRQIRLAVVVWIVHIAAFAGLLLGIN